MNREYRNSISIFLKLFICTLPFTATSAFQIRMESVPLSYFISVFVIFGPFLLLMKKQKISIDNIERYIFLMYIFYFLIIAINFFLIQDLDFAYKSFKQLINYGIVFIHYLIIRNLSANLDRKTYYNILKFFIIIGLIISIYGIYQFVGFYLNLPFTDILRNSTLYCIFRSSSPGGWIDQYRISGFSPEPSMFGYFILLPLSFMFIVTLRKFDIKNYIIFIIIFIAFFLTFSRSAWVAFLLVVFLTFVKTKYKIRLVFIIFITIIVIISFGYILEFDFNKFIYLILAPQDTSFQTRVNNQIFVLKTFFRNPFGFGLGSFIFFNKRLFVPHNYYLLLLYEVGLLGVIFFLIFIGLLYDKIRNVKYYARLHDDKDLQFIVEGLEIMFFAIIFSWVNSSSYNFSYIWFVFGLIGGLNSLLIKERNYAYSN